MMKWWDAGCRCPRGCSALKAPWSVPGSSHPSSSILLGTHGGTGAARPCPAGRNTGVSDGLWDTERDKICVFPSCNHGCKKDGQGKLHKVNVAVLFPSKSEWVETLCHVNPSCCAAEFSFDSFFSFFFLIWLLGCQGWIQCFIKLQPGKRSSAGRC